MAHKSHAASGGTFVCFHDVTEAERLERITGPVVELAHEFHPREVSKGLLVIISYGLKIQHMRKTLQRQYKCTNVKQNLVAES